MNHWIIQVIVHPPMDDIDCSTNYLALDRNEALDKALMCVQEFGLNPSEAAANLEMFDSYGEIMDDGSTVIVSMMEPLNARVQFPV